MALDPLRNAIDQNGAFPHGRCRTAPLRASFFLMQMTSHQTVKTPGVGRLDGDDDTDYDSILLYQTLMGDDG